MFSLFPLSLHSKYFGSSSFKLFLSWWDLDGAIRVRKKFPGRLPFSCKGPWTRLLRRLDRQVACLCPLAPPSADSPWLSSGTLLVISSSFLTSLFPLGSNDWDRYSLKYKVSWLSSVHLIFHNSLLFPAWTSINKCAVLIFTVKYTHTLTHTHTRTNPSTCEVS